MADGKFVPKAREKNLLDSKRITLSIPCPVKGVKGWSNLCFYANNDNPGITVYTGDPNDKDNNFGRIQAKYGLLDLMLLLEQLDAVIRSKEPIKMDSVCKSIRGQDKKQMDVARVEVGKNTAGVVYIMLEDLERSGRPMIHFPFSPSRFHNYGRNGVPMEEAELSVLVAKAFYRTVGDLVLQISKDTYKHPEPKQGGFGGGQQQQRGGNGGGYNNNNRSGGGGGYSNNSDAGNSGGGGSSYGGGDADDDIPY
jgi:hypothetical protein